jgi:anthranilate phosphoribosyltransferase
MTTSIEECTDVVIRGESLARDQAAAVFGEIVSGNLTDEQIKRFLAALADKGETVDEIVGAVQAMRQWVTSVACPDPEAVDTCGTGGDGISTFNVSSAAAIIATGAGACVAKHGNYTNTRKSGSAEVFQALGVNIEASPEVAARCLREVRIAFLFAANLHPAMKHAAPARRSLARRTIFNLVGPLTNPAGVRRQVIGVARPGLMTTLAEVLRELGAVRVLVVHGHDGLCDLTITGSSSYVELRDGRLETHGIHPQDVGLKTGTLDALRIKSATESAAVIRSILAGDLGTPRDHALLNAAATLLAAGIATDLRDGVARAAKAIDTGAASAVLDRLVKVSGEPA